jgi:hypothetical protein
VGIDFSLVRYLTILGFSDGRIVAVYAYFRLKMAKSPSVDVVVALLHFLRCTWQKNEKALKVVLMAM